MNAAARKLLARMKNARGQLSAARLPDEAVAFCIAGLSRMEGVLARPPRVAILGEFNAGKTSVADLLLGAGLLPASVVANTRLPVLLRYAQTTCLFALTDSGRRALTNAARDELPGDLEFRGIEIGLPSERLMDFQILDTPTMLEPGSLIGDADVLIWCTVATRAWTESERVAWSALPPRCRRNGLLVATHKDALRDAGEAARIEQRLRTIAGPLFRDILLVSAADAPEAGQKDRQGQPRDSGAGQLLERVRALTAEITERRVHKVEKIIRRLARLTFHHLASGALDPAYAAIVKDWEAASALSLKGLADPTKNLSAIIEDLLREFAQFVEKARPGAVARQAASHRPVEQNGPVRWPVRVPAAQQRFARVLAADLTALLRIELAQKGLRNPVKDADYRTARSVLLSLADLDGAFDALGQLLSSVNGSPPAAGAIGTASGGPALPPLAVH
jgi:hypothetical protein